MARTIDGTWNRFLLNLSYLTLRDFQENKAGLNTLKTAVESQPTLTPPNEPLSVLVNDEPDREYIDYICPRCKDIISQRRRGQRMETVYKCKFHDNCGQRVDWSNPQPYRRQPEGEA